MNLNLAMEVPQVFDIAHLGLAGVAVLLLLWLIIVLSCRPKTTQPDSVENDAESTKSVKIQLEDIDAKGALQLLSILQNEGRLVDFIREDVSKYTDTDIGAAARVVHKGVRKAFDDVFTVEPILQQEEGESITLKSGFKPQEIQLLGQVSGDGPFTGVLVHQGWRVKESRLPKIANDRDSLILAPAQVEIAGQ